MPGFRNILRRLIRRSDGPESTNSDNKPIIDEAPEPINSEPVSLDIPDPESRELSNRIPDLELSTGPVASAPSPEPEVVLAGAGIGASDRSAQLPDAAPYVEFGEPPGAATGVDDDVLYHDHLLLECPYCGFQDQRVGGRCEKCGQVIIRLPSWAQKRRQNWFSRRLSLRRILIASAIALFIVFVIWIQYPFTPDPVVLFKNIASQLTIDSGPGSWSVIGRDLRHSRFVETGHPPPVGDIIWQGYVSDPISAEPVGQRANIYLSSANGIYPLAEGSGQIREGWEGDTPGRITAAPAIIETYLYFGSTDRTVNSWDAFTGDPRWSFVAEDIVEVAPVVAQGLLYISSGDGWVYALDAARGHLVWQKQLDSNASAAVAFHEGKIILGDDRGTVYILSARTGQEWFRYRARRAITGSPVISDDGERVYFAAGGELYAVKARKREIPGLYQFKRIWAQLWLWHVPGIPRPSGQQGGLWRFTPDNPLLGLKNSPAIAGDDLYAGGHDHNMYALDAVSGDLKWTFRAKDAIWSSPLIVKDHLIFGDDSGALYALNRADGELIWEVDLKNGIRISPSLINDLLIVRTRNGAVYAIGNCATPERVNAPNCVR